MEPIGLEVHSVSLGTVFALLAFVLTGFGGLVAWGVGVIRGEVQKVGKGLQHTNDTLNAHIHLSERRFATLEAEWKVLSRVDCVWNPSKKFRAGDRPNESD